MNELEKEQFDIIKRELGKAPTHDIRESLLRQYRMLMKAYRDRRKAEVRG